MLDFLKKYPMSILLAIIALNLFSIADTLKKNGKLDVHKSICVREDAFVYGDYLVGSYGIRSDKDALLYIADQFELEPVLAELAQEKFYHLDTCFQNFPSGDAIFYQDAYLGILHL